MPTKYDEEAIDFCRRLYITHGGKNLDAVARRMRKVYPGWHKRNLFDSGTGEKTRRGWINRYGFDNALKISLQIKTGQVKTDEQDLYLGIRNVRRNLQRIVETEKKPGRDTIYQFRDFAKLEIEARRNLDVSPDNLETFVAGYEKLLDWLTQLDREAAKMLVKHGEKLAELAQAHYGKEEKSDGRAADACPDEGGD